MPTHATTVGLTQPEIESFRAALWRARETFGRLQGVQGVGFGQKHAAGDFHDLITITVIVSEKKPLEALPVDERIPATFEDYPTDVLSMGPGSATIACNNSTDYTNAPGGIQGGIQIVPQTVNPGFTYDKGTLGCIVRRRGDKDRENVYLLTCKHVLFAGGAHAGHYVYHPFAQASHGQAAAGPSNVLGPIQKLGYQDNVPYTPPGSSTPQTFYLDCATARIDIDCKCFNSTCTKDHLKYSPTIVDLNLGTDDPATPQNESNMIAGVRNAIDDPAIVGKRVYKVGRSTGRTVGLVRVLTASEPLQPDPDNPGGPAIARAMIRIDFDTTSTPTHLNCLGNERFAEGGDSGSVVVDENRNAVGLVAISASHAHEGGPPPKKYPAFACHILPVLDLLQICIATSSSSSHGSCSATDGSGLTSAPAPQTTSPTGRISFLDRSVTGASGRGGVVTAVAPEVISEAQRARMLAFRDGLVSSPSGRELHDTFVRVRRELGYLVRNSRPVKVVWHRNHGPAFLAHILNHLKGDVPSVPHEIAGISRGDFLTRMGCVLSAHGSIPLRDAIERYRSELLPVLVEATDMDHCLRALGARERSEVESTAGAP